MGGLLGSGGAFESVVVAAGVGRQTVGLVDFGGLGEQWPLEWCLQC